MASYGSNASYTASGLDERSTERTDGRRTEWSIGPPSSKRRLAGAWAGNIVTLNLFISIQAGDVGLTADWPPLVAPTGPGSEVASPLVAVDLRQRTREREVACSAFRSSRVALMLNNLSLHRASAVIEARASRKATENQEVPQLACSHSHTYIVQCMVGHPPILA